MANTDTIQIDGLKQVQQALRSVDAGLPKMIKAALTKAADVVINDARPKVPRRSGRAAGSIKVQAEQRRVRIKAGGTRAPYYMWLDFGGTVGKGHKRGPGQGSVKRRFIKGGRYLWASFGAKRDDVIRVIDTELVQLVRSAGLEVTSHG